MTDITYILCGNCHQISPVMEWQEFPEATRCPACDFVHSVDEKDPGTWSGTFQEMQEQHGALHDDDDDDDDDDALEIPPEQLEHMVESVNEAARLLTARMQRLEVVHSVVGLIFLSDADAALIRRGLRALIRYSVKDVDHGHARVLAQEMQSFVEGMSEVKMLGSDGEA